MEKRFCAKGISPMVYFEKINKWLEENSGIRPLRLCVGEFVQAEDGEPKVYECTLVYDNDGRKGVTYSISYYHKISGVKIGLDVMKSFWQEANPHAKIALCSYCHTVNKLAEAAYDINGSVVANCNCMWIIYEKCEDILEFTPADFYHLANQIDEDARELQNCEVTALSEEEIFVAEQSENLDTEIYKPEEAEPAAQGEQVVLDPEQLGYFCAFCGERNVQGAVFCAFCGEKML